MTSDKRERGSLSAVDRAGIEEALEQMIPKSLDDVVRKNRNAFQIGLATPTEIAIRGTVIKPDRDTRDTIEQWNIIAFRTLGLRPDTGLEGILSSRLSLLGRAAGTRGSWLTSEVVQIDVDGGLVLTRNSLYRLGSRGEGEPPPDDLICVCAVMHSWGIGELIGAPGFFY
jgi:hypothetical protein